MKNVLLLFAHPRLERSRVNIRLLDAAKNVSGVTVRDLYEEYPLFDVDVVAEKALLLSHDVVVLQHPFFWYSAPPLVKQWIDLVLEFGWAYGPGGTALQGKKVVQAITTGGTEKAYSADGRNRYTVEEFLRPFEATFKLCNMEVLPPFVVSGTHRLTRQDIELSGERYRGFLEELTHGS